MLRRALPALALLLVSSLAAAAPQPLERRFAFGTASAVPPAVALSADAPYTPERGFGFETGAALVAAPHSIASEQPFFFSVDLPEGNYRVHVVLGDDARASTTTVKAELRRLMLEAVAVPAAGSVTRTFIVNLRTPRIAATGGLPAGEVKLKAPRETTQEAWAWDRRLTLEFNGDHPAVRSLAIEPADVPTLFLLGDSTVCDQSREPYASWGQMLPRWFAPTIAVANHGESGETYRDSLGRRRLDKILSVMRPGDTLLLQFGHNDQKQIAARTGGPFTTYAGEIEAHITAVRARGGIPVIISPMERLQFDAAGHIVPSLADYAAAARQAAEKLGVAFIDLHAMSITLYEALGPARAPLAFAHPAPGKIDPTHHNNYGAYELAQCIALGLRRAHVDAARHLLTDFHFDPAHPDAPEPFDFPASPLRTDVKPLGN